MGQSADVVYLKGHVARQFARYRQVKSMRIGTLDLVVQAGYYAEQPLGRGRREAAAGRCLQALRFGRRGIGDARESRAWTNRLRALASNSASPEEAGDVGGKPEGTELIKSRGNAVTDAVVDDGIAAANGDFSLAKHVVQQPFFEVR